MANETLYAIRLVYGGWWPPGAEPAVGGRSTMFIALKRARADDQQRPYLTGARVVPVTRRVTLTERPDGE